MTNERPGEQEKSQVVPMLVAALLCDVAVREPVTRKQSLIGIFDEVRASEFPTSRPFTLYFKVADAEGYIEVRYVKVSTQQMLMQAHGKLEAKSRLSSTDLSVQFDAGGGVPIPSEGRYEFQIWANGTFLGSTSLLAVPRDLPAQEEQNE